MNQNYVGYILTENGQVFVRHPDDNRFGWSIEDDDQTFPGGSGGAGDSIGSHAPIADDDPRITEERREQL